MRICKLWMIVLIISTSLVLISCTAGEVTTNKTKPFWQTIQPDCYITNDISRAQVETPFTIVVPRYIPKELGSAPFSIEGSTSKAQNTNPFYKRVIILYGTVHSSISISEYIGTATYLPSDANHSYLEFVGIEVLEQLLTQGNQEIIQYHWNKEGIHFDVEINNYEKDVCRKIIASMIT
jgi:hypothetical protein